MKTLIRVVGFYGIGFALTIILSITQRISGIDAGKIVLPQFGPGLAALVMLVLFRRDGWKPALSHHGIPFPKYLGALGIPILASAILFAMCNWFVRPLSVTLPDTASFAVMLGGMLLGAFGEELGWRGYLQNLLDKRANGFIAFLVVGILWGCWHVGNYPNGPMYMLYFVLFTIGCSGVMAWLLRGTNYNVVVATLFHCSVNAGFYLLKDAMTDLRMIALIGIVWAGAAAVLVVFNRGDFFRLKAKGAVVTPTNS
jgi:uncharacterized protein